MYYSRNLPIILSDPKLDDEVLFKKKIIPTKSEAPSPILDIIVETNITLISITNSSGLLIESELLSLTYYNIKGLFNRDGGYVHIKRREYENRIGAILVVRLKYHSAKNILPHGKHNHLIMTFSQANMN